MGGQGRIKRAGSHRSSATGPTGRAGDPGASARLPGAAGRLLAALDREGAAAFPDPTRDATVLVQARRGGVSLGCGSFPESALRGLRDRDLVEGAADAPGARRFVISEAGRAHLRRSGAGEGGFALQHREIVSREVAGEDGPQRVSANVLESPLDWLRRRRGPDGEPLIDAAGYEAGERLRRDLTFAAMLPSVTARWEGAIASGGGCHDPASASDAVVAARQRVRAALAAIGRDFADLLVDLCGFLKGLEAIERERRWPARSGKVVARLALAQLARHYGLGSEARGPERSLGLRTWEAAA